MIDLDQIRQFFPEAQQKNPLQYEYINFDKKSKDFEKLVFDQAENLTQFVR